MKASSNAIELIKKFEGLRLKAYLCPSDKWTIGWGHTGDDVFPGMEISKEQADNFLHKDISVAEGTVYRLVKANLNQNQFDALVSFVFNIGETQFSTSTLLRKLNFGDYGSVPEQLKRWNKSGSPLKVTPGLVKRRQAEAELWMKPVTEG